LPWPQSIRHMWLKFLFFVFLLTLLGLVPPDIGVYSLLLWLGLRSVHVPAAQKFFHWRIQPHSRRLLLIYGIPLVAFFAGLEVLSFTLLKQIAPGIMGSLEKMAASELAWTVLAALTVGPIVEEFLFRGLLPFSLMRKFTARKAIVIASLIYGILNVDFVGTTLFAICLCLLYREGANLFPVIILHWWKNLASIGFIFLDKNPNQGTLLGFTYSVGLAIVLVIITMPFVAHLLWRYWPHKSATS
jgi:membrane protease YdiL (CAAX protease family)